MTLDEFLLARLARIEAWFSDEGDGSYADDCQECAAMSSVAGSPLTRALVLADCAAKRALVKDWQDAVAVGIDDWDAGEAYGLERAVKHFAATFAGHPDYDPKWKVS